MSLGPSRSLLPPGSREYAFRGDEGDAWAMECEYHGGPSPLLPSECSFEFYAQEEKNA